MKTLLTLVLIGSCSSPRGSLRELYPKDKARESGVVLNALKASGLRPVPSGQTSIYRAENVTCVRDLNHELWKCGFLQGGRQYEIPSIESSTLAGILVGLPVPQGDSGAATPFIECRMFDTDPENAACDVAISLDSQGP